MEKRTQTFFREQEWSWGQRFGVMVFAPRSAFFEALKKEKKGQLFKIEAPRFWEGEKLWEFICQKMSVRFSPPVRRYLLDSLPHEVRDFIGVIKHLKLHFPDTGKITLEEIESIVEPSTLNSFELATVFNEKKFNVFFEFLWKTHLDFDTLRSFFSFMQGHLGRLADPSYLQKKRTRSRYDKSIEFFSQKFNLEELRTYCRLFGELEILAKQKSLKLKGALRWEQLQKGLPSPKELR